MTFEHLDNVAGLFAGPPKGPSQGVSYRQGTVVAFDPVTLENIIDVGGTQITNLPILGVGEATLLVPDATVGIIVIGNEGGGKTLAILGRLVIPNTPDASKAVSLLNSQIYADFVPDLEAVTSGTLADLTILGPSVDVPIGASGRVLIIASAFMGLANAAAASVNNQSNISIWASGANTYQPAALGNIAGIAQSSISAQVTSGTIVAGNNQSAVIHMVLEGLNPGITTFTMKSTFAIRAASSISS